MLMYILLTKPTQMKYLFLIFAFMLSIGLSAQVQQKVLTATDTLGTFIAPNNVAYDSVGYAVRLQSRDSSANTVVNFQPESGIGASFLTVWSSQGSPVAITWAGSTDGTLADTTFILPYQDYTDQRHRLVVDRDSTAVGVLVAPVVK